MSEHTYDSVQAAAANTFVAGDKGYDFNLVLNGLLCDMVEKGSMKTMVALSRYTPSKVDVYHDLKDAIKKNCSEVENWGGPHFQAALSRIKVGHLTGLAAKGLLAVSDAPAADSDDQVIVKYHLSIVTACVFSSNAIEGQADAIKILNNNMEQVFTAIKDVKLTRKLQAWERSASTGDRVADLKALDSLDPPPAKKCRHDDEDEDECKCKVKGKAPYCKYCVRVRSSTTVHV